MDRRIGSSSLYFGFGIIITLWLLRYDPDLLQERITGLEKPNREDQDAKSSNYGFLYCMAGTDAPDGTNN